VLSVAACSRLGLSLTLHSLNVFLVAAAVCCGGVLAWHAFKLRPAWLGIPAGVLAALAWMVSVGMLLLGVVFDGNWPQTADLGEGVHCRETVYGFVTADSGTTMAIYRRHLLIDRLVGTYVMSDIYPQDAGPEPALLRRCQGSAKSFCHYAV
jgi:hypothetical protein